MFNIKKTLKIGGIILGVALILFFAYFVYLQTLVQKGELIKWQGKWYTKEDWRSQFGDYDTPEKNTPEQVYAQFRQALLNDDIETALGLVREEKRGFYQEEFKDVEKLEKYKKIPAVEKLDKSEMDSYGNFSIYYYSDTENSNSPSYSVDFEKNREGFWLINSI